MNEEHHSKHNPQNLNKDNLVQTDANKCVGCNRCIRVCPVETANIAYQDEHGGTKVVLDSTQCILCGACIKVCEHDARHIGDDTERFFEDLENGVPISVMAAPSMQITVPEWKNIFSWLRTLGVQSIYDVSLGADICVWAHLRTIEKEQKPIITQPCPVIVSFCENHKSALLPNLSPVHSPMACAAIYMKKQGVKGRLASISPCIAKTKEHRETGLADYNITFTRLLDYIKQNNVSLPAEKSGFDHPPAGPGKLFPVPGGLLKNISFFMGDALYTQAFEGAEVFDYLAHYAEASSGTLPDILDVLSCREGCLGGPGTAGCANIFTLNKQMQEMQKDTMHNKEESMRRLSEYDSTLNLSDYLRTYTPTPPKYTDVSDKEIEHAFADMKKDSEEKRHFDCGACGSESCYNMARKIALGVNIPTNCVITTRDEAKLEKRRNAEYLALVQDIGDNLFSTQTQEHAGQIQSSLRILSETINCSAIAIWSIKNGICKRENGWYGSTPSSVAIYGDWPEDWIKQLEAGDRLLVNTKEDKPGLFPDKVVTLFVVPIHIRGEFWGFVDAISTEERGFTKEEASLLEAAGILLISGILEQKLNKSLVNAKEDALAASQAKGDFLSNMSHEIRTPINAIIGMTAIGDSSADIEQKNYAFDRIKNASAHLLGVIDDILDMSKIEANKLELSPVDFEFEEMLKKVVSVSSFRMEEKHQTLHVRVDTKIPLALNGDDQRLAQVITNLMSNAVKFTPDGGTITVETTYLGEKGNTHGIRVSVTDTGIGIDKEHQAQLFNSFVQAESGISRKFGGTGLGLAISKEIVELMGGKIWVESEPEKGAEFVFEVWLNPSATPHRPMLDPETDWRNVKIFVADGDAYVREQFAAKTKQLGLYCSTAATTEEAVHQLETNGPYTVCFICWQTPQIDGAKLVHLLKASARPPEIIAMSTTAGWGQIKKDATAAGTDGFLLKPLFPATIAGIINNCVSAKKQHPHTENPPDNEACFEGLNILLAEDVEINREIVLSLLEPTGIAIDTAENGKQAVELFCKNPDKYDAVFMDMQMPEMDGCEATRQIRALTVPRAKNVPVIAMTANVFKEDIEKCLSSGMNAHLGKPLDIDEVIDVIKQYTDGAS